MDEHPPLPTLSPSRGGRASFLSPLPVGQAQDEEEGSLAGVPLFLMLSLSKHEEVERPFLTTQPPKITIKTTKPQKVLPVSLCGPILGP